MTPFADDPRGFASAVVLVGVAFAIWVFSPEYAKRQASRAGEPDWEMLAPLIHPPLRAPSGHYARLTQDADTLVIGDSMVLGWPEQHGDVLSFPTQTTNQIADALDRMTVRPYERIVLWAGTADLGIPWSHERFETGFGRLLTWSREHAATVLVVQPAPVVTDSGWLPHDVATNWLRDDGCDPEWFRDGLHPSLLGYAEILERLPPSEPRPAATLGASKD